MTRKKNADKKIKKMASKIRLVIFDVDGVLTDGRLYFTEDGQEFKAFSAKDGVGMKMLLAAGIDIAIITGRNSPIVERRFAELGVRHIYQGRQSKLPAYETLKKTLKLQDAHIAYVGDDTPDLPPMQRAGLRITVADASPCVHALADWVTTAPGGRGAAREVCELILTAQGAHAAAAKLFQ